MDVTFDWSILEKVGIAGICLALIYFGFQLFKLFMAQWQNSTDAVNKNTNAFMELSRVFERQNERDEQFQREIKGILTDGAVVAKDTNSRVRDIQVSIK